MKILVDASVLSSRVGGISRYLHSLLGEMQRQSSGQHEWILCGRGDELCKYAQAGQARARVDHFPFHLGRVLSLFTSLPYWARQEQADLYWGPAHRLPLWLPAGTKKVVTVHDLCWLEAPETMRASTRSLDALLMPRSLRSADAVVAVSSASRDSLLQRFPELSEKLYLILEGSSALPAPKSVDALDQWRIRKPYVLFVGTLEPRKNLPRLLEAFAKVRKRLLETDTQQPQLVVVGDVGWGGLDLPGSLSRLGLSDFTRVLGHVSDEQLSTLYRHAACLAMPALYEGFGLPLVEAMAQGTPVLTSSSSSMPEVAGQAGRLVNPLDVSSIEAGLLDMLTDLRYRESLAACSKAQAAKFSWKTAAIEMLQLFQNLAQNHHVIKARRASSKRL